jgi:hypothetical protein
MGSSREAIGFQIILPDPATLRMPLCLGLELAGRSIRRAQRCRGLFAAAVASSLRDEVG